MPPAFQNGPMGGGALTGGGAAMPPPPNPSPQQPQQQGAQQPPQAPPAPTHTQTVAALRHFQALTQAFKPLLSNPDLGKADMKSGIIDAVSKLVAERIVPPNAAVQKLAEVPERPFDQRAWVQQQYAMDMQARGLVLAHHAQAFAGQPPEPTPNSDNHMQDISGMMQAHYAGRQ